MKDKTVYSFGGGTADGDAKMKNLLGGKGANLAEMATATATAQKFIEQVENYYFSKSIFSSYSKFYKAVTVLELLSVLSDFRHYQLNTKFSKDPAKKEYSYIENLNDLLK